MSRAKNLTFFCLPSISLSWNKLAISYKAIDEIVELYELIISILNNLETKKALRSQKFKYLLSSDQHSPALLLSVLRHYSPAMSQVFGSLFVCKRTSL